MLPEGLLIGPKSRQWRVGELLGAGACGSVHEITREAKRGGSEPAIEYVVKIAPIPADVGAATKRRKKKKTALERNADLIHYENVIYRSVLNDLRGNKIPQVPHAGDGGPPGYGDIDGYRYLCMEKMDSELAYIVPMLLEEQGRKRSRSKAVPLGMVACALLDLVQAIHQQNLVFVDVKPENFMLSSQSGSRAATCDDICERMRMIDFGLVENFRDATSGGHREDMFPAGQMVGTPVYASLNVLEGHTASRRDDMEALGYVILELILLLSEGGQSGSGRIGSRASKGKELTSSPLPWSDGKSDEEILDVKKESIEGRGAKNIFKLMNDKNGDAANAMKRYFSMVRDLKYSEKPNYADLRSILEDFSVKVDADENERKPAATRTGRRTAGSKRSPPRNYTSDNDEPEAVIVKRRKTGRKEPTEEKSEVKKAAKSSNTDDSDVFHSCCSKVEHMDWEVTPDDDPLPSRGVFSDKTNSPDTAGGVAISAELPPEQRAGKGTSPIEVFFVAGPHKGESFALGGESTDVVTVGTDPPKPRSKTSKNGVYRINNERNASTSHVRFALHSAKGGVFSVRVTDLKSDGVTEVNGKAIGKGKHKQAFVGNKIRIGGSVMQLKSGR